LGGQQYGRVHDASRDIVPTKTEPNAQSLLHELRRPHAGISVAANNYGGPAACLNESIGIFVMMPTANRLGAGLNGAWVGGQWYSAWQELGRFLAHATDYDVEGMAAGLALITGKVGFLAPQITHMPTSPAIRFYDLPNWYLAQMQLLWQFANGRALGQWNNPAIVAAITLANPAFAGGNPTVVIVAATTAQPLAPFSGNLLFAYKMAVSFDYDTWIAQFTTDELIYLVHVFSGGQDISQFMYLAGARCGAPPAYNAVNGIDDNESLPACGVVANINMALKSGISTFWSLLKGRTAVALSAKVAPAVRFQGSASVLYTRFLTAALLMRAVADGVCYAYRVSPVNLDAASGIWNSGSPVLDEALNMSAELTGVPEPIAILANVVANCSKFFGKSQILSNAVCSAFCTYARPNKEMAEVVQMVLHPALSHALLGKVNTAGGTLKSVALQSFKQAMHKSSLFMSCYKSDDLLAVDIMGIAAATAYRHGNIITFGTDVNIKHPADDSVIMARIPFTRLVTMRNSDNFPGSPYGVTPAVWWLAHPYPGELRITNRVAFALLPFNVGNYPMPHSYGRFGGPAGMPVLYTPPIAFNMALANEERSLFFSAAAAVLNFGPAVVGNTYAASATALAQLCSLDVGRLVVRVEAGMMLRRQLIQELHPTVPVKQQLWGNELVHPTWAKGELSDDKVMSEWSVN